MRLVKRGNYYYLRLRRGGVEEWVSTHKTSKREAEKSAERILMVFDREKATKQLARQLCQYAVALARGEISLKELSSPLAMLEAQANKAALDCIDDIFPLPAVTAMDLWERYIEVSGDVKASTLQTKRQRYMKFAEWAKDADMRTLNEIVCRRFLDSQKVSLQTRKNYISDLSSVFNASDIPNPWTAKLRTTLVSATPTKTETKERSIVSPEQAQMVLAYCDSNPQVLVRSIPLERWAAFLRVLYYTGLRPVDVCFLTKGEIENGFVELTPEKTSRTRKKISYKADPKLLTVLESLAPDQDGMYFPDFAAAYKKHRSETSDGFRYILKRSGLTDLKIQLYGFRHHFITYQIESGIEDEDIEAAVGHSNKAVTYEHYYHGRKKVELNDLPEV